MLILLKEETLERIAAEYGIEEEEMNEILKEAKDNRERFKEAIINSVKIDFFKKI